MLWLLGSGHLGLLPVRVLGFELGRQAHAELGVKPLTTVTPALPPSARLANAPRISGT
jgi:hypothetical protein